jgi:arylsulfatase A-like enzyme
MGLRAARFPLFALLALTLAGLAAGCGEAAREDARPNIVLIVVDDLGWNDFGARPADDLRTPHLDALAAEGVRFTSAYSAAPLCSPARAGLLTGRYPQRFGHEHNTGSIGRQQDAWIGLPVAERTLADRLRDAGYATGMVGKWHLGARQEYHPLRRGFDSFFGFLPGHHPYHQWSEKSHNPILRNFDRVRGSEYLTDAFTREAVAFVDRHAPGPFFLMLAYSAVHEPLVADDARQSRMAHLPDGARRTFAAALAAVDDGVGRLVASLRAHDIDDRTLVLFTSDNGARGKGGSLQGDKGSLREAGVRVPLLARWPGRMPAHTRYAGVVSTLDLFATAASAAGIAYETIDGVDLLPHARGDIDSAPHDTLYWRLGDLHAMREGRWKLAWSSNAPPTLHDLIDDPAESTDLAPNHPERVEAMQKAYTTWESELEEPRWQWQPGQPAERGRS